MYVLSTTSFPFFSPPSFTIFSSSLYTLSTRFNLPLPSLSFALSVLLCLPCIGPLHPRTLCVCVVRNFFIYLWGLFGSFSRMNVIIVALCTVMIVRRTPLVYRDICIFQYCCLCSTFRSHFLRGGVIITIYLFIKSDFHLFSFTELVFV